MTDKGAHAEREVINGKIAMVEAEIAAEAIQFADRQKTLGVADVQDAPEDVRLDALRDQLKDIAVPKGVSFKGFDLAHKTAMNRITQAYSAALETIVRAQQGTHSGSHSSTSTQPN